MTAVGAGTAKITAASADGGASAVCSVTVVSTSEAASLDQAILKVLGNANGDKVVDSSDAKLVQDLIAVGAKVSDANKMADANNDGAIDSKDVDVINKIIARQATPIWHINVHDVDSDGNPDKVLVETQFPISSVIMTGSQNSILLFWMLGITEEV